MAPFLCRDLVPFYSPIDSGAKQSIERQACEDRSAGKSGSDLESFMALEEIKKQELHLKELMIWAGRPGLWDGWIKFQAQARVQRQQEEAEREAWTTELHDNVGMTAVVISLVVGIFGLNLFRNLFEGSLTMIHSISPFSVHYPPAVKDIQPANIPAASPEPVTLVSYPMPKRCFTTAGGG